MLTRGHGSDGLDDGIHTRQVHAPTPGREVVPSWSGIPRTLQRIPDHDEMGEPRRGGPGRVVDRVAEGDRQWFGGRSTERELTMIQHISRRRLIAGTAGVAGAAALATSSRPVAASGHTMGGPLVTLFDPIRLFDSRDPGNFLGGAKLADGDVVAIIANAPGVDQLRSVFVNITVTQTEGAGFLAVRAHDTRDDVPPPTTSNINWLSSGLTLANLALSQIGSENSIEIHCTGAGASTHVIVDLQGYVPFVGVGDPTTM